jgi:hypothetical protein
MAQRDSRINVLFPTKILGTSSFPFPRFQNFELSRKFSIARKDRQGLGSSSLGHLDLTEGGKVWAVMPLEVEMRLVIESIGCRV